MDMFLIINPRIFEYVMAVYANGLITAAGNSKSLYYQFSQQNDFLTSVKRLRNTQYLALLLLLLLRILLKNNFKNTWIFAYFLI